MALLTEGESPNCRAYAELTRLKSYKSTFNHNRRDHADPIWIEKTPPLGYKQELPAFSKQGKSEHYA